MDELAPPMCAERFLGGEVLLWGQQPSTVLRKAYAVIYDMRRWTNMARALDKDGRIVHPSDPTAACWCLEGAVAISSNPEAILHPFFMKLLDSISLDLYGEEAVNCLEAYGYLPNPAAVHSRILHVLVRSVQRLEGQHG